MSEPDKRVLMIAFDYPPIAGSSGLQRTLSFSRQLPAHGWAPIVLTAHERAYRGVTIDQLADIPEAVPVKRAFALDAARHLSIRGKYPDWLEVPDRWASWWLGAVPAGLRLIRKHAPQVIWSTYPIATAHLIAWTLHRLTGLPWVADFRDPMVERNPRTGEPYPADKRLRKVRLAIERNCATRAHRVSFCAPGAQSICMLRYPEVPASRWAQVPNGFDERVFSEIERTIPDTRTDRRVTRLVHSGTLYPGTDRNPDALLDAIRKLLDSGRLDPDSLRVVLRASGHDNVHRQAIEERNLGQLVTLAPALGYRQAIAEMMAADGLLLLQGYTANAAIPAKLYEYFRAGRPILALADAPGDTAALLRKLRFGRLVPCDDSDRIAEGLLTFLDEIRRGQTTSLDPATVAGFSRDASAATLAGLLHDCLR